MDGIVQYSEATQKYQNLVFKTDYALMQVKVLQNAPRELPIIQLRHEISNILTSVDYNEPLQPPLSLETPNGVQ